MIKQELKTAAFSVGFTLNDILRKQFYCSRIKLQDIFHISYVCGVFCLRCLPLHRLFQLHLAKDWNHRNQTELLRLKPVKKFTTSKQA